VNLPRRIHLDRIGSATSPARVGTIVEVAPEAVAEEGAVVVVRALGENPKYGEIELPTGRMARVVRGNLIAGVLGARRALHGYMGHIPESVKVGDTLSLLNIGGVIGVCSAPNRDLGPPIGVEVLGGLIRSGKFLNIRDFALPPCPAIAEQGPALLLVVGTCMNSGKTYAATEIIRVLSNQGHRIAAGKLSGVAALKDVLRMSDNGAVATASFLDCGYPSTVNATDLASVARSVIAQLEKSTPDAIVLELGDGIIGGYNVDSILADPTIRVRTRARVLCANDLVGAWGGASFMSERGHAVDVMSGPVTDNAVGTSFIRGTLRIDAANARLEPEALASSIAARLGLEPKT
jgi:hypothetical protein